MSSLAASHHGLNGRSSNGRSSNGRTPDSRPPGARLPLIDATRSVSGTPIQLGLDDLGTPLSETTFVVVDLETTGGSPRNDAITEIGAVKVRGGEVLGEFQTLVNPGIPIPPAITVLTGITHQMVVGAPRIDTVLPAFLEFAGLHSPGLGTRTAPDLVLVAHNAPFDVGFLKAAATQAGYPWPNLTVLDTVRLARAALTREEAPNVKLATLARLFGATVAPDHRALSDARATVDVLHALLERMAPLGLSHLEDLRTITDTVPHHRRRKAHLADGLTTGPGVYMFLGPSHDILYVGRSVNVRSRVRSYFTASESRRRIGEMVDIARGVRQVPCPTEIEAQVRELRLIDEHEPPYNRRSRRQSRRPWLRLTDEPFPRLSIVTTPPALDVPALGPFPTREAARRCADALEHTFALRRCTVRMPRDGHRRSCTLGEMGRCGGPCAGVRDVAEYALVCGHVTAALQGDTDEVELALSERLTTLTTALRYEEAAVARDRRLAFLDATTQTARLDPLWRDPELAAVRRTDRGTWEVVIVRYGRLAATEQLPAGSPLRPQVAALRAVAAQVTPPTTHGGAATYEETRLIAQWLDRPGVVHVPVGAPTP